MNEKNTKDKNRISQIRAYADAYVNGLGNISYSGYMRSIITDAIEDAIKWADSHPM